jgi:hypothetical protein
MARERCGAKKKNGKPCQQYPMARKKRCRLHGGAEGSGRPVTTGRYAKLKNKRIADLVERHGEEEDILDIKPEVILLRALTEDYINRYDEITEALLAWHEDNVEENQDGTKRSVKPPRILDLADSYRLISEITKIVKRIEDVKANNAINQKDFYRLIQQMGITVKNHIDDKEALKAIAKEWNTFKY